MFWVYLLIFLANLQQNGCLDDDEMDIYRVNKDGGEKGNIDFIVV